MRRLVPLVTAGVLLAGGISIYGADKAFSSDVVLSVDGRQTHVKTFASTVGQVLAGSKIEVGEHDTVAPALSAKVTNGTQISVRYGRPVTVTVDGAPTTIWTTATTVEEALGLFGVGADAKVSTSRSTTIDRDGLTVVVSAPHTVHVTADGKTTDVTTYGTVADALTAAGLTLASTDTVTPSASTPLADDATITVVHVEAPAAKPAAVPTPPKPTARAANTCGASWYATGSRTANGEAFNPNGLTAANKTLPFNTRVLVTNVANGKSVTVRITDRGPYVAGRCLDLARGAFSKIAALSTGAITVTWQVV